MVEERGSEKLGTDQGGGLGEATATRTISLLIRFLLAGLISGGLTSPVVPSNDEEGKALGLVVSQDLSSE